MTKAHLTLPLSIRSLRKYIYQNLAAKEAIPFTLNWDMTKRCNLSCPFCYIHDENYTPHQEPTFQEMQPILDQIIAKGCFHVTLSGGECTLIKDFVPIYTYLRQAGCLVTIFSNGIDYSPEVQETLVEYPPHRVEITLYTNKVQSPAYRTVLFLKENNIDVLCKMTVTKNNSYMYQDIKKWCESNAIAFLVDSKLFSGDNNVVLTDYQLDKAHQATLESQKYPDGLLFNNERRTKRYGFPCRTYATGIYISADRQLAICSHAPYQISLKDYDFSSAYDLIWNHAQKYQQAIIHGCQGCSFSYLCDMCPYRASSILEEHQEKLFVPQEYCQAIREQGQLYRQSRFQ